MLAAREKNGVYIAQENYEQITREIELQRKEIVEKLEQIKAMEEEAGRKEETFQSLQQLIDETQAHLQVRSRAFFLMLLPYLLSFNICDSRQPQLN